MKKKKVILATFLAVSIYCLFFSLIFSDGGLFFRKNLTLDYSLKKNLFANSYNLVHEGDGKVVVKKIKNWIITEQYLYGTYEIAVQDLPKNTKIVNSERYFLINRQSADIETFSAMNTLSLQLRKLGIKSYEVSDEESFVHLKYHKRKYQTTKK